MTGRRAISIGRVRVAVLAAALALVVTIPVIVASGGAGGGAGQPNTTAQATPASTAHGGGSTTNPTTAPSTTTGGPTPGGGAVLPAGFSVRAGTATGKTPVTTPVAVGEPLPQSTVATILSRLPEWTGTSTLATDFRFPRQTLIKPAAGQTIGQTFPAAGNNQDPPSTPDSDPDRPASGAADAAAGQRVGGSLVSITFNQPMIPVSTVGQLADTEVPAVISPAIPGHWDWLGTETLRFTADSTTVDRLPMATRFSVTVPAGTKAQSGGTLATAVTATFSTPPPAVQSFTPVSTAPLGLHPVFVAVFNQRVDPAAALESVTVTANGQARPVRAATPAEVAADHDAAAAVSAAPTDRTVAFVAAEDFSPATTITVTVGPGTRSAEGPLTSTQESDFFASTYPPMTFTQTNCQEGTCRPGGPIVLSFSNPIDTDAFDPTSVAISPALPGGASISATANQIVISGAAQPATTYRVTVQAGLKDVFGQGLAQNVDHLVDIAHADKQIDPFPTSVSTLDPMVPTPTVTITTVNQKRFRERVFAVDLGDWAAYRAWYTKMQQDGSYVPGADLHVPAWTVLADRIVTVSGAGEQVMATTLDLSSELTGGRKQAVLLIEPVDPLSQNEQWQNRPTTTWVQSTTLGVDALADQSSLRTWVTDLRTGSPLAGVTVAMIDGTGQRVGNAMTTDAKGLGSTDLPAAGASALLATAGDQSALLPGDMWGPMWKPNPQADQALWYVNDDRQTYRPGETVSVKGWVRRQSGDTTMGLTTPDTSTVSWSATDGYGNRIGSGKAAVDPLGGFDLTLAIPAAAHLGNANLHLDLGGETGVNYTNDDHSFTIADYRTPAFQVDTHAGTGDPAIRGADLSVQTDATYYAGGPVGNSPVAWQVKTATATYSPPGWGEFTFGVWTPWWYDNVGGGYAELGGAMSCCGYGSTVDSSGDPVQTFSGTTDGAGSDYLAVKVGDLGKSNAGLPVTVVAQATVTDVNRQQIAGTVDILVHPASYYVGLASDSTFVKQGEKLTLQAIATGIDGTAKAGLPITVTAARAAGGWGAGQSTQTLVDPQTCTVTSAATPVTCTFTPTVGGEYQITATVTDEQGRTSRTQLTRWVAGADGTVATTVQEQSLTLIPDRQEYQPGQSATLLVASPISSGTGLITLSHNGIVSTSTFAVASGSAVVTIPITEAAIPGLTVNIEVVGSVPRAADPSGGLGARPAYATGQIDLAVSAMSRSLTVTAKPRQSTVKPGGQTTVDVTVTDQAGKPMAGSQFEVIVVDEAVLSLSGYQLPSPLDAFYPRDQRNWLLPLYGRSLVTLGQPSPNSQSGTTEASSAAMTSDSAGYSADSPTSSTAGIFGQSNGLTKSAHGLTSTTPIDQRSAFAALALFKPSVTTGADGTAAVPVTLPDNLTRYRVMVVAVAGTTEFGTGESTITAGLPLTVRPSAPRFLNFGDKAELPVVVQNLTDSPLITDVVLQAANLTVAGAGTGATAGAAGKRITVPANGRVEVRFDVAADQAGTAQFRVAAVSGDAADAAQESFPVYTPSTSETFATYGSVEGNTVVSQKVSKPTGVIPGFGGLQISTSSTALAQLSDAVNFVAEYKYQSSDALAGQVMAIASLGDVLQAFSAPGLPSPAQLKALVVADIGKLIAMQNSDGGFPYWQRGDKSDPFNSVQVVQSLLTADEYGYTGSTQAAVANAVKKALPYLRDIDAKLPAQTSAQTRDSMNAYALAVRSLAGDSTAASAGDTMVTDRGSALPLDAVAWLLPIVSAPQRQTLLTTVNNRAVDDAKSVTFTDTVVDDSWTVLQSSARTDALILDALLTVEPHSDLVGKVVNGLMAEQQGGRWDNLQENAFTLVALRHYYDTYEATTPNLVAAVWLGKTFAGQHQYAGHTTEQTALDIPTSAVLQLADTSITLQDNGSGRMYYRIGLTTAPASLSLAALDRGFAVSRTYQGADSAADVTRDSNGVWHIKAGARVRITVTMVSRSAQSHVALSDPLPAGLEALNPALATTSKDLAGKNAGSNADPFSWAATWYDHQDLLDDRAEAFSSWLQGGVYTYSYLASATTPGTFVAPPATARQIYTPETFGRTTTDRVVVELIPRPRSRVH